LNQLTDSNTVIRPVRASAGPAPTQSHSSVLKLSALFLCRNYPKVVAVSALVLVPCIWHVRIIAGDLASHMYNAWLAQLIERGQVTGLWIERRWNNVLFDLIVSGVGKFFSLHVAEKITVSMSVLIFFWGTFAFVSSASRRAPWFLTPVLAMITYGYTFHMGFFNYYLSLGIASVGIAVFWRGNKWERLIPFLLAPVVLLAHPLGLLWMAAAIAYIGISEAMPVHYQPMLVLAAAATLVLIHYHLWHHYVVEAQVKPFYFFNGSDQLLLFGSRYEIPALALVFVSLCALAFDILTRRQERGLWTSYSIPVQLYVLLLVSVLLLPDGVRLQSQSPALALLSGRLTSVSAAAFCCLLGVMRPRKWHLVGFTVIAAVFFTFLYQDTGTIDKMEEQAARLERTLPPNQRILATILPLPGSRILIQHIADRACIGYCFSYGNYEPSSTEFRVRALPGNPYVMSSSDSVPDMEEGTYEVQPEDLPAYQLYQCTSSGTDLCIRPLDAGEENGRLGIEPHSK